MSDLIRRADAIEELEWQTDFVADSNYMDGETLLFQDDAVKRIKELPSASEPQTVLESAKAIRDFLSDKECCSTHYWDSDRNVIMRTDIGYFDEGLQELIEYLEKEQKMSEAEIRVGSEIVCPYLKSAYIVTKITKNSYTCLRKDGTACFFRKGEDWMPTGRHFDIESFLAQM